MSRYFLTELQIEGFRGINNEGDPLVLKFKTDKVNSVFGENARGKSSIFEALSYALTGEIPKLAELPADDKADAYYCNRFHSTETATIVLTVQSDAGGPPITVRVVRNKAGGRVVDSPSSHPNPEALLASLAGELTLLDYTTFRRFVEDSPLRRGQAFSALLGLSKISLLRQTFDVLSNEKNIKGDLGLDIDELKQTQNFAAKGAQLQTVLAAQEKLLGEAGKKIKDLLSVAKATCEALAQVPLLAFHVSGMDLRQVDFDAVRATIKKEESDEKRATLESILKSIAGLEQLAGTLAEPTENIELLKVAQERDAALKDTKGPLYLGLYESVAAIFEAGEADPTICPACEWQHSAPQDEAVKIRLEKYSEVSNGRKKIQALWKASVAKQRFVQLEANAALAVPQEKRRSEHFVQIFGTGDPSGADVLEFFNTLDALESSRTDSIKTLKDNKEKIQRELPLSLVTLTEQVQEAETIRTGIMAVERLDAASAKLTKTLESKRRWKKFIEYVGITFSSAEVKLSTLKTKDFEDQYRTLYKNITKNPDILPILKKAKGTEALHLRLDKFHTLADVAASTLLPESYRNALALSIYLAAAVASSKAARFIVFDDVTSSFDAGHQFWLMEVLRTAIAATPVPGIQVLIFSHDGLLEKYFDRMNGEGGWHHCRLAGSPPCGKTVVGTQDSQKLRADAEKFAKAGQVDQAKPLIRQYLEQSLLEVIRALDIGVPIDFAIRDDQKMVKACLDVIADGLDLHGKAGMLVLPPAQVTRWKSVIAPAIVANYLAHYATGSSASVAPGVYLGLLATIDEAVDCFKYDCSCSGQPKRVLCRSLSSKNRGKTCRC